MQHTTNYMNSFPINQVHGDWIFKNKYRVSNTLDTKHANILASHRIWSYLFEVEVMMKIFAILKKVEINIKEVDKNLFSESMAYAKKDLKPKFIKSLDESFLYKSFQGAMFALVKLIQTRTDVRKRLEESLDACGISVEGEYSELNINEHGLYVDKMGLVL